MSALRFTRQRSISWVRSRGRSFEISIRPSSWVRWLEPQQMLVRSLLSLPCFFPNCWRRAKQSSRSHQTAHLVPLVFTKKNPLDIVILCGSPGAGKSTFYWKHMKPLGYERINQDILKTVRTVVFPSARLSPLMPHISLNGGRRTCCATQSCRHRATARCKRGTIVQLTDSSPPPA